MKKLTVLFVFLSSLSFSQNADSTRHRLQLSIVGGIQFSNHTNGGLFYKAYDFNEKNSYYNQILSLPIFAISLGVKYKNVFQMLDFSSISRKGYYDLDFGNDNIKMKCFSYQIWYNILNKYKFPINPLLSLNLAYIDKTYDFLVFGEWGGGNTWSEDFKDVSKTFLIQMPVGVYLESKKLLASFSYNLPVYAWIKGSFQDKQEQISLPNAQHWSKFTTENYSGNLTDSNYEKVKNSFNVRLSYIIKL